MLPLIKKEIKLLLSTNTTYVFMIVYFIGCTVFLWIIPDGINIFDNMYASLERFFTLTSWLFIWLIPSLCMKMIAEEKRAGTLELLITRPFSVTQLILSKFLAGRTIIFITLLPTLVYLYTVYQISEPVGNIDMGVILLSYIGLFSLSFTFLAISIFSSSITSHQAVSFIIGSCLCFLFYIGFEYISSIASIKYLQPFLYQLSIHEHCQNFFKGIIDSRDLLYFVSMIFIFLFLSIVFVNKSNK